MEHQSSRLIADEISRALWVAFDLDNTLHDFRKASKSAARIVFYHIWEEFGISPFELEEEYRAILKARTAKAFVDGKSSREYRSERFAELLDAHDILPDGLADELADLYGRAMEKLTEELPGATELISRLKGLGKSIAVISEGPEDAQESTLETLGLRGCVDRLFTSNAMGVSKPEGLFQRFLEAVDVDPSRALVIGDSLERDIVPATGAGMGAIWLTSSEEAVCQQCKPIATAPSLRFIIDALEESTK